MELKLKAALTRLGRKQVELGRALGYSPTTMSQLITHGFWPKSEPREALKERIKAVLRAWSMPEADLETVFEECPKARDRVKWGWSQGRVELRRQRSAEMPFDAADMVTSKAAISSSGHKLSFGALLLMSFLANGAHGQGFTPIQKDTHVSPSHGQPTCAEIANRDGPFIYENAMGARKAGVPLSRMLQSSRLNPDAYQTYDRGIPAVLKSYWENLYADKYPGLQDAVQDLYALCMASSVPRERDAWFSEHERKARLK